MMLFVRLRTSLNYIAGVVCMTHNYRVYILMASLYGFVHIWVLVGGRVQPAPCWRVRQGRFK